MKFKHYTKDKFGRETTTALVVDKPVKNKKPVKGYALFFFLGLKPMKFTARVIEEYWNLLLPLKNRN